MAPIENYPIGLVPAHLGWRRSWPIIADHSTARTAPPAEPEPVAAPQPQATPEAPPAAEGSVAAPVNTSQHAPPAEQAGPAGQAGPQPPPASAAATAPDARAAGPTPKASGFASAQSRDRAYRRRLSDELDLHLMCRNARCRRSQRCSGNATRCLRTAIEAAPVLEPFARHMLEEQGRGTCFEEALNEYDMETDIYFAWVFGLKAGREAGRR